MSHSKQIDSFDTLRQSFDVEAPSTDRRFDTRLYKRVEVEVDSADPEADGRGEFDAGDKGPAVTVLGVHAGGRGVLLGMGPDREAWLAVEPCAGAELVALEAARPSPRPVLDLAAALEWVRDWHDAPACSWLDR